MGQLETKKQVQIQIKNKAINEINLNSKGNLKTTRNKLKDKIDFPFTFLDDDNNEVSVEDELSITLEDILDGKKLHIKKQIKQRAILGTKIDSNNDLNYYIYPKFNLTDIQKKSASNIMIIGETGVGKSTWIHSLLNYLEEVQIDENVRYLLFDEKRKQKEYEIKYGKKSAGSSVTDEPEIYDIAPTKLYNNPLRLIDTTGFGDTRGIEFDNRITKDILNLLETSKIDNIKAICLILKATETRAHDRFKYIMKKIFSMFGEDVKYNFIFIFNFIYSSKDIPIINVLKNQNLLFFKIFGDISNLPKFYFNNKANFDSNRYFYDNAYENNIKNFENFFNYLSNLKPISLENTKKIISGRNEMRNQLIEIYKNIDLIKKEKKIICKNNKNFLNQKSEILEYYNSSYSLYCNNHDRICHKNCKGSQKCLHFGYNRKCLECKCSESNHKYIMNYNDKKEKEFNINILKDINISNEESINSNNKIYHILMNFLETSEKLILKNKELNLISLKKEDENDKNGYIHDLLNEIIKNNNKITDFIKNTIKDFENLTADIKEEKVINFIKIIIDSDYI